MYILYTYTYTYTYTCIYKYIHTYIGIYKYTLIYILTYIVIYGAMSSTDVRTVVRWRTSTAPRATKRGVGT